MQNLQVLLQQPILVPSPSHVQLLATPWTASMPGSPVPHLLPKFAQVHVHCIGDAIQLSHHPLMPLLLPSVFPNIRDFSSELAVRIR